MLSFRSTRNEMNTSSDLDRRLQEDWARDAGEDSGVLMSLRVDFWPIG